MNTIGKSAYAPADVSWFWGLSAMQASLLMDSSKMYGQIMVFCHGDAKSVNEIADELGIAPVYLEKALEKLQKAALLISLSKGKYQANCCVFPKEAYVKATHVACNMFHDRGFAECVTQKLYSLKEYITALPFYGNHFDYRYLMWILYVEAGDSFGICGTKRYVEKYKDRYPDEADRTYRVTMEYLLPDEPFDASQYGDLRAKGWSNLHQQFAHPKHGKVEYVNNYECDPFPNESEDTIDDWRRGRNRWLDEANVFLLIELAKDPKKALTPFEEEKAAELLKHGLLKKENDGLAVQLPIFTRDTYQKIAAKIREEVRGFAEEYADLVGDAVEQQLLPFVRRDQMSNFIHWDMRIFFQQLKSLFYHGWDTVLAQPEDYTASAAGLCIVTM